MKSKHNPNDAFELFGEGADSSIFWALPAEVTELALVARIQTWHRAAKSAKKMPAAADSIVATIEHLNVGQMDIESVLTALGAAHSLWWIRDYVEESIWHMTVGKLVSMAAENSVDFEQRPWLHQLSEVELPMTLSRQLSELPEMKKTGKQALKKMSLLVAEILDGDGWPACQFLSSYGPLMASWSRCSAIAKEMKWKIPKDMAVRLEWAVRQTIRLSRPDGTLLGSDHKSNPFTTEFVHTMLRMTPDVLDRKIAVSCLNTAATAKKKTLSGHVPEDSGLSEWAEVGVLQSEWKRNACKLALTWGERRNWIEIVRQVGLIDGDCTPQISFNGILLAADGEFELVCENLDDEIDYLELELRLAKGVTLNRQIMFGKQDQFALLADVIHSPQQARFDYRCEFPLYPGITALEESETREFYLRDKKIRSLVLPLALPEWKTARSDDSLTYENDHLVLQQSILGQGLCAPLFFDLSPKRSVKPRTWRQLTVAEVLKIVDKDVAVAFRIQVGKDQWIYYRTVANKGNRSFMSQNVVEEFYFGRFNSRGDVKELLLIE